MNNKFEKNSLLSDDKQIDLKNLNFCRALTNAIFLFPYSLPKYYSLRNAVN